MKFKRLFLKKCEFVENVNLRKVQILSGIFHHRKKAKHIFTHHRALQKQVLCLVCNDKQSAKSTLSKAF